MGRGGATIAAGEGRQVSVAVRGGIVLAGGQGERAGATEESAGSAGLSSQQKDGRRSATWDRARNGTPPRRKLTWGGGSRCCSCYPWGKMDTGGGEGGFSCERVEAASECRSFSFPRCFLSMYQAALHGNLLQCSSGLGAQAPAGRGSRYPTQASPEAVAEGRGTKGGSTRRRRRKAWRCG